MRVVKNLLTGHWIKGHWQLIVITALVFALWNTPLLLPLKILTVFFHEAAHGLAAVFTGGEIEALTLSAAQGGMATTRGGNIFVIYSAGYLGSLAIGLLLFLIARHTRFDRALMALLGLAMLLLTALYIRDFFAVVFTAVTAIALLASARFLRQSINDLFLRIIALTSMIYVPYDIFSDTIARSTLRSDAFMLAERFGGSALIWGGIWLVISLVVIGICLRYGLGTTSNIQFGQTRTDTTR